jgi:hypothetical protein
MEGKKFDLKMLYKQKKIMVIAIVLIIVMLAGVKIFGAQGKPENVQTSANAITVETTKVGYTDSMGGLTYKANLEPAEEATVSSNVSGQVTQVLFENGDKVNYELCFRQYRKTMSELHEPVGGKYLRHYQKLMQSVNRTGQ